jgi:hypothetical protein
MRRVSIAATVSRTRLVALVVSFGLATSGCGGRSDGRPAGDGVPDAGPTGAATSVSLPPGFPLPAETLTVATASATAAVDADGAYEVPATQGLELAVVEDGAGSLVMTAFVDSGRAENRIGPPQTAQALLFLALGGYRLPRELWPDLLGAIAAQPATHDLTATLSSILVSRPTALTDGDERLTGAVRDAARRLAAASPAALTAARRAQRPLAVGPDAVALLIEPAGELSGVELVQATLAGRLQAVNHFRRHAELRIYETGFTTVDDATGEAAQHPLSPPAPVAAGAPPAGPDGRVILQSTLNLGSFVGLVAQVLNLWFNSYEVSGLGPPTAFVPTVTDPWSLALDGAPGTTQTSFTAVVLGGSFNWTLAGEPSNWQPNPPPAIASDARFQSFIPEWYARAQELGTNAFFFDLLFPLIGTAMGARDLDSIDDVGFGGLDPLTLTSRSCRTSRRWGCPGSSRS